MNFTVLIFSIFFGFLTVGLIQYISSKIEERKSIFIWVILGTIFWYQILLPQ